MKILFVYPNITRAISPQLGICMLSAVAKQLGHECALYDLTIVPQRREITDFVSKVKSFRPDVLAITCRSNEWNYIKRMLTSTDTSSIIKILGGPHVTLAPEDAVKIADTVVLGEGEETFRELLIKIDGGADFRNVAGTWSRQGDKITKNKGRLLIQDINTLPLPDWEIFDDIHYYNSYIKKIFKGSKTVGTFEGSRGCPYNCTYCSNQAFRDVYEDKTPWRREKTPQRLIEEMKEFRSRYDLDCIYFVDEVFLTRYERLEEFRDLYSKEIGVPFTFMERPENMTEKKAKVISESGAKFVALGIESGDQDLRKSLLKRRHSQEKIVSAFHTAKKNGISTHAFTMIGFPGQDRKSVFQTYNLLREAKPDTVQASIFYPLVGTELFDKVVAEGLFDPDTSMPEHYYRGSSLNYSKEKKDEIMRDQYLLMYYKSKLVYYLVKMRAHLKILRMVDIIFKINDRIKNEGLRSTLKAVKIKLKM